VDARNKVRDVHNKVVEVPSKSVEAHNKVVEAHKKSLEAHIKAVEAHNKAVEAYKVVVEGLGDSHHFEENPDPLKKKTDLGVRVKKKSRSRIITYRRKISQIRIKVICSTTWLSAFFPFQNYLGKYLLPS
jgi:hypothetical protein